MIRVFPNEQFKEFELGHKSKFRHAVSNYGRLVSFEDTIEEGRLLKGGTNHGYSTFSYYIKKDNKLLSRYIYLRKLVAENFLKKTSADQVYVLLLDRNRRNCFVGNLKWATRKEMLEHRKKSPKMIAASVNRAEFNRQREGHKLTSTQVIHIKKKLQDPNRKTRMKTLAKQFGISEMQLYRIKSGENWGHIIVD